jgi:hypothetical protein
MSTFLLQSLDASDGGLLVPDGIIHPVVNGLALTWFIKYIFV